VYHCFHALDSRRCLSHSGFQSADQVMVHGAVADSTSRVLCMAKDSDVHQANSPAVPREVHLASCSSVKRWDLDLVALCLVHHHYAGRLQAKESAHAKHKKMHAMPSESVAGAWKPAAECLKTAAMADGSALQKASAMLDATSPPKPLG